MDITNRITSWPSLDEPEVEISIELLGDQILIRSKQAAVEADQPERIIEIRVSAHESAELVIAFQNIHNAARRLSR